MKEEKIRKEKKKIFDFKGLFKNFVSGSSAEETERDIILNDASLSDEEKKELLGKMDYCENLSHELFTENLKINKNTNSYKNTGVRNQKVAMNREAMNSSRRGQERGED